MGGYVDWFCRNTKEGKINMKGYDLAVNKIKLDI